MARNLVSEKQVSKCDENGAYLLDPAEFCRLLLSRKHLIRDDRTGGSAMGLIDPISGERFKVDGSRLDRFIERIAG